MPRVKPLRIIIAGAAAILALTAGCQPSHKDLVQFLKAYEHDVSAIEYRVGIPDAVSISAPQVLEIDRVTQTIQPDGKLSLRLLGQVKVVGMTEKEIAAKLTDLLQPYYEDPKVQVRVQSYLSKRIYLFGQIGGASGSGSGGGGGSSVTADSWISIPYTGRDTVLDVLAKTGLSFIAWRSQVHLIRSSHLEEERHDIVVDVDHMMRTGDTSNNVLLQPDDIVFVPPTPLGWVGLRVQEVLFPFRPVVNGYTFPATLINANDVYEDED
jgi:protein involved in polysaccharide export with SLBB domain